jgi:DNA-binding CsgD family transcriptional regulator
MRPAGLGTELETGASPAGLSSDRTNSGGRAMAETLVARKVAFGAVDHNWRFSDMSADAAELLGREVPDWRGTPLQSVVHPQDTSLLLLALGRSGDERRAATTCLRVRDSDGGWTLARLALSPLCNHNPARFAVVFWSVPCRENPESPDDRASRLEDHLWRIAMELEAAGISDPVRGGPDWSADSPLSGLSRRQVEILRRLTRGERVSAIARELFISQSTVRNHLSAIYRRVGVHSQSELLARLMPANESSAW